MVFKTQAGDLEKGEYEVFNYFSAVLDNALAMDDLPEEAGEYVLTCTVTGGGDDPLEYTFSWESTSE